MRCNCAWVGVNEFVFVTVCAGSGFTPHPVLNRFQVGLLSPLVNSRKLHVTRHSSHITPYTSHITRHVYRVSLVITRRSSYTHTSHLAHLTHTHHISLILHTHITPRSSSCSDDQSHLAFKSYFSRNRRGTAVRKPQTARPKRACVHFWPCHLIVLFSVKILGLSLISSITCNHLLSVKHVSSVTLARTVAADLLTKCHSFRLPPGHMRALLHRF